jgi:hypothetical protein
MVQVDERSVWQQIRQGLGASRPRSRTARPQPEEQPAKAMLELDGHCLSLLLSDPALLAEVDKALELCGDVALAPEDWSRSEDQAVFGAWKRWLATGGSPEVLGGFYDTLDESLQERVTVLLQAREGEPLVADSLLQNDVLDVVSRLRLRNLRRQIQELRFLLEDTHDGETAVVYGPLITNTATRIRGLQQAMNERSISGRRQREDAAVRIPFAEE